MEFRRASLPTASRWSPGVPGMPKRIRSSTESSVRPEIPSEPSFLNRWWGHLVALADTVAHPRRKRRATEESVDGMPTQDSGNDTETTAEKDVQTDPNQPKQAGITSADATESALNPGEAFIQHPSKQEPDSTADNAQGDMVSAEQGISAPSAPASTETAGHSTTTHNTLGLIPMDDGLEAVAKDLAAPDEHKETHQPKQEDWPGVEHVQEQTEGGGSEGAAEENKGTENGDEEVQEQQVSEEEIAQDENEEEEEEDSDDSDIFEEDDGDDDDEDNDVESS